jgi:DNA repair exonuclease SbcCD ATPase subunit
MRIEFEFVRWKNLLSYGNYWTEFTLNKTSSTLIVGPNGVGKSVFLDALMYLLYGKPARDINKPQMVNSIIGKGLMVEGQFKIGKKTYFVRRGDWPGIFDVYVNGELQKATASKVEDQKNFVKNVIKMSDKSFKQIVILGSANYVPFMQLSAGDRRKIIEDLLDIQIFSVMNALLTKKVSVNKAEIQETDTEIRILQVEIDADKKHIETLKQNNDELIVAREAKIEEAMEEVARWMAANKDIQGEIDELAQGTSDQEKLSRRLNKLTDMEKQLEDRARKLKKDISFFHENDDCPTCKQGIGHDFKAEATETREKRLNEISEALEKLNTQYQDVTEALGRISEINNQIAELNGTIYDNNSMIAFHNRNITALTQEIDDLRGKTDQIEIGQNELNFHLKELSRKSKVKERLSKNQSIMEVASVLLKDTGIKTKIIKQYIPIMNKLINKYLAQMDFFCNFELDENFNEKIKSRHRDEFGYNNFSEGQKARIDLALLFTWRAVARLRNSAGTNILVMDEVFDGSLDAQGTEELLRIIQDLVGDTHIFVISHKDALYDKFHSVIEFEMVKNFSQMKRK